MEMKMLICSHFENIVVNQANAPSPTMCSMVMYYNGVKMRFLEVKCYKISGKCLII